MSLSMDIANIIDEHASDLSVNHDKLASEIDKIANKIADLSLLHNHRPSAEKIEIILKNLD